MVPLYVLFVPIYITHLLIGSTSNISGLMTECLKIMENWKMYKNRVIGFCKIRGNFFLVHRLVTLLVYDYIFDHTSKIFLYNLDCDYSMINASKIYLYNLFLFSEEKKTRLITMRSQPNYFEVVLLLLLSLLSFLLLLLLSLMLMLFFRQHQRLIWGSLWWKLSLVAGVGLCANPFFVSNPSQLR